MAVDMRARYFGEFDEGAMPSSFGVLPQAVPQPSAFEVMPTSGAAPIMDTPRKAAVMPMTTEAVAPNYLSGLNLSDADLASLYALSSSGNFNQGNYGSDFGSLDDVYGMNFGSDLGSGGSGGGLYKVNPYMQTLQAPLSDKGNSTASAGGGIDVKSPTQTFRLLDKNTGQVVYEGVGYEGAQEAIDRASALTAEQGAKAQWQIQTPNSQQESGYSTVANEKRSQSTLGDIASVALPVGMALLTGGLSLPAQMAAAGIAGAAGAGLAGKNPAKAGLISAATAGLMGGTGANEAIGKAVGNVGGQLLGKTAEEVAKQAAAEASGEIVATGLSKVLQGAGSAVGNTLLSQGVKGGLSEITGYKTPAEKFAQQQTPNASNVVNGVDQVTGEIVAMAPKSFLPPEALAAVMGVGGLTAATAGNVGAGSNVVNGVDQDTGEIVVNKYRPINPPGGLDPVAVAAATGLPIGAILDSLGPLNTLPSDPALMQPDTLPDDIVVNAPVAVTPETGLPVGSVLASLGIPQVPTPDPALTDGGDKLTAKDAANYLRLANLAAGLIGGIAGGGGGGGGTPGSQAINPIFSAKLPTPGKDGAFKVGGLDYTTPPARSAADMYRYAMGPAMDIPAGMNLSGATSPYAGYGPGTLGEETFKRVAGTAPTRTIIGQGSRLVDGRRVPYNIYDDGTSDPFVIPDRLRTTAPITTPVPNNPAGPIMTEEPPRFAEGGAFAAKGYARGSSRDSFAVEGPGTGRSDDIPAVLSDGEYVIDAETVALLGDGSSKAGAKKLDEMRVKVRKHKGRNLAKGKFSVNAKRPEKYLSGGRT
jgi:hypothetical protein